VSLDVAAGHAQRALELEPPESPWGPSAHLQLGTIRLIQDDLKGAESEFEQAALRAGHAQPAVRASAQAYLAAIELRRGRAEAAAVAARRVRELIAECELGDFPPMAFPIGVVGRILAARSDPTSGGLLRHALALLDGIAFVFPPADAWIRAVIAEGLLEVGDVDAARETVAAARRLLARHPVDARLEGVVRDVERRLDPGLGLHEPLTSREREVLEMLVAVRSLNDIAAELVVSHNTVKTHARSIYRKLGVRSRREAIGRARALGLLTD
jgi:LuxR family maltose regulon positive regulatory protein